MQRKGVNQIYKKGKENSPNKEDNHFRNFILSQSYLTNIWKNLSNMYKVQESTQKKLKKLIKKSKMMKKNWKWWNSKLQIYYKLRDYYRKKFQETKRKSETLKSSETSLQKDFKLSKITIGSSLIWQLSSKSSIKRQKEIYKKWGNNSKKLKGIPIS